MSANTASALIPLSEVARLLSVSVRTIYRLVAEGELPPPLKVGRASRFEAKDVQRYLDKLRRERGT